MRNRTFSFKENMGATENMAAVEEEAMADEIGSENSSARASQRRATAATAIGMNVLKPIMLAQVSIFRMWADSIERFAANYEKGFEEAATKVEKLSDKERAA